MSKSQIWKSMNNVIQVKDESQEWKSRMTASQGWKAGMKFKEMKVKYKG